MIKSMEKKSKNLPPEEIYTNILKDYTNIKKHCIYARVDEDPNNTYEVHVQEIICDKLNFEIESTKAIGVPKPNEEQKNDKNVKFILKSVKIDEQNRKKYASLQAEYFIGKLLGECCENAKKTFDIQDTLINDGKTRVIEILMENYGEDFKTWSEDMTEEKCISIIMQLLNALEVIEKIGISHLDIKPQNILWDKGQLTLIDFGSSVWFRDKEKIRDSINEYSDRIGAFTRSFAPPEVKILYRLSDKIQEKNKALKNALSMPKAEADQINEEITELEKNYCLAKKCIVPIKVDVYCFAMTFLEILYLMKKPKLVFPEIAAEMECKPEEFEKLFIEPRLSALRPDLYKRYSFLIKNCLSWNLVERPNSFVNIKKSFVECILITQNTDFIKIIETKSSKFENNRKKFAEMYFECEEYDSCAFHYSEYFKYCDTHDDISSLAKYSFALSSLRKYEETIKIIEITAEKCNKLPDPSLERAIIYNYLGHSYMKIRHYDKALEFHKNALAIKKLKSHFSQFTSLLNIAICYSELNDDINGKNFYNQAIEFAKNRSSENKENLYVYVYKNAAIMYSKFSQTELIMDYMKHNGNIGAKIYRKDHQFSCNGKEKELFTKPSDTEKYEYCNRLNNIAISIVQKQINQGKADLATLYSNQGSILTEHGDFPKAIEFFKKSESLRNEIYGKNHPDVATSCSKIGAVYIMWALSLFEQRSEETKEKYRNAINYLIKDIDITKIIFGYENPILVNSYMNLAYCYLKIENFEKSECVYNDCVKLLGGESMRTRIKLVKVYEKMLELYEAWHKSAEREKILRLKIALESTLDEPKNK